MAGTGLSIPESPRTDTIASWAKRTIMPAMALSLVMHACFILIAALVFVRGGGGGGDDEAGGGASGPVEMA
jgi:hypothetical protein